MAVNKNAFVRFNTLDRCFSNFGRKFYFKDLKNEVNAAINRATMDGRGIEDRQLRSDIAFMRSQDGFDAPIIAYRDGRSCYYRYEDRDFSIYNSPLNSTEVNQLRSSIAILQRFEGAPQFGWVNELSTVLQDRFDLNDAPKKALGFGTNIDYTGYNLIPIVFDAIINKRVLNISYQSFEGREYCYDFHPYYLKEYRHRWFALGRNNGEDHDQWVVPLDRIKDMKEIDAIYVDDSTDWEDYFYDVIGVTRKSGESPVHVVLQFSPQKAPYIVTKPILPSQKQQIQDDGSLKVDLFTYINVELKELLMSFGSHCKILRPKILRDEITDMAAEIIELHKDYDDERNS